MELIRSPGEFQWRIELCCATTLHMKRAKVHEDASKPVGRLIGYGRVSTNDQNPDMQMQALLKAGVHPDNLHIDAGVSGIKAKRRALGLAFLDLREGDTLLVWKIDRLGRDLPQLIRHVEMIRDAGAQLKSITEPIDTSTPMGKAFFYIIGVIAQLERDLISERTRAGVKRAQERGQRFGAAPKLDDTQWMEIERLLRAGGEVEPAAARFKVSASLVRKHFQEIGGIRRLRALGPMPSKGK